jgi:uncharacterized protein (TIGR02118 family)
MIKICEIIWRRPGMSVADFQDHWLNRHGPIVARLPGLRRYVQCHPRPGGDRHGALVCDGVAELWLDSKAALIEASQSTEFAAAKADEANFVDPDRLVELLTEEVVIRDLPAAAGSIKIISLVHYKAGLDPVAAQSYWRETHAPIVCGIEGLGRYEQNPVRLGAYRKPAPPAFDGLALTWFDDMAAARRSSACAAFGRTKADEANFLEASRTGSIITAEHVIVG